MRSAADASGSWTQRATSSRRGGLGTAVLVFLAAALVLGLVGVSAATGLLAWDVRFAYLPAADAVLRGDSPYPALDDPILEDQKGYVYPPQLALTLLPLAPLPVGVAAALVAIGMVALILLTLRVLEVEDPRCYAAALLWVPSISGVLLSNLSIPLAFALAVSWRYRNGVLPPALALGLSVSAKLLLWPMLVWMLATRRVKAVVSALLIGVAVTAAAWALIGFDGLTRYPDLLRRLSEIQAEQSYSIVGMSATLGLGPALGQALTLLVGGGFLVGCVVLARRGDEVRSFTCAVAATLAVSPIVWLHYLVLLLVPVAVARPRFSAIWLLPALLWISPKPGHAEGVQTFFPAIAIGVLLIALLARAREQGGVAEAGA